MVNEILLGFEQSKDSNTNFVKRLILGFIFIFLLITNQVVAQTAAFNIKTSGSCTPVSVALTDKSTGAYSWLWDFGNSNGVNSPNAPSFYYITPGVYTVSLTINGGGNDNLISKQTVNVYPAPNPTIPVSLIGCEPFSGILTADATPVFTQPFTIGTKIVGGITGGKPVSYTWNFAGALPTVTQNTPELQLTDIPAGSYDVLLTVTDEHGCSNSVYKQNVIYVSPKPKADFKITKENNCNIGKVTFTGTSTISNGSIASYAWDIDNNGTIESTQKDFSYTFSSAGTYNVAFTVTSDEGCTSDKTVKQVIFNNDNKVWFSFTGGCINHTVNFTDESGINVIKWSWDFDNDGTIDDTKQNPVYTYSTKGLKTVKLKVMFNDGCEMETTRDILISEVKSDFSFNTNSSCAPAFSIAFNSTSTVSSGSTISTYAWDFDNDNVTDDITPNPTHNFNSSGTFPVRLIVGSSEGCTDTIINNVVIPDATIDFSNSLSEGCAPFVTVFSPVYSNVSDPVVSYIWDFGDSGSGANNSSTLPNPSHTYNLQGDYDVKLTATTSRGCIIEKTKLQNIKVGTSQLINSLTYIQTDLCQISPVSFEAKFNNSVDKLIWNFNDGTPPVEQDVTGGSANLPYIYKKPGTHSVTVKAWCNGCESTDSITQGGILINEPTADFTPSSTSGCSVPDTISFANTSISKPENTIWEWNFGDGSPISNVRDTTHIYNSPGIYNVKLNVTNIKTGCTAESKSIIYINTSNPQFTAKDSVTCSETPVEFTNQIALNSSPGFAVDSLLWDFGDGKTSTEANPTHSYSIPGLYTVSLKVTETHGCVNIKTKTDYINVRGPIVDFKKDKTQICSGALVSFTDLTTKVPSDNADPLLNKYLWNFGDGETSSEPNPSHIFIGSGKYSVSLQVTDNHGCVGTKNVIDSIVIAPTSAGFSTPRDSYCTDSLNKVVFTNTAKGSIISYDWDLDGDGTFELLNDSATQSRTFPTTGVYNIKQRVKDRLGCEDTFSKQIHVVDGNAGINIAYMSAGCAPVSTIFEALDTAASVSGYLWKFGDGVTSTERKPSHDFLRPGHYNVALTEELIGGCTKTNTMPVDIAGALGTFSYDNASGCVPHSVTFHAGSLSGVTELIWDLGDGSTQKEIINPGDTAKTITYTYNTSGSILPVLILRDTTCGAFSYFDPKKRINVSENPIAVFSAATVSGATCEKFSLQFTDQSTKTDPRYSISTWDWDFGDSTTHSFIQNPTHIYTNPGSYIVTLKVTNGVIPNGCGASVSQNIIVNPLPVATSPTQIQSIYTGLASDDIAISSLLEGTTYIWTRTNPDGINSTQPMSGTVSVDGKIPGAVFENTTKSPVTVTYTIIPIGPTATYCEGNQLIATVTVNPNPLVSLLKTASKPIMNNNGTFKWNYTIKIINNSDLVIDSVQVYDNLDDVFKNSGCTYKVTSIIASGNLIANGIFNGSGITATLLEGKTLGAHQQDSVIIQLEVDSRDLINDITVYNQALLTCLYATHGLSILSDADPLTTALEPTRTDIPVVNIFIPDAFSPNQDQFNEYFIITHSDLVSVDIEVFNRWGNSVYKSTNYKNDWNGKGTGNFLGNDLPAGTYYCIYKVINISTGEGINKGIKYITLRR
jgi:gliding motility-associated-like protein